MALQAATTTQAAAVPVAGFEIDGNTPDGPEAGTDWSSVGTRATDPVGNADTTTFQSSKEFDHPSTWVRGTGLAPNQDDVSDVYTWSQVVGGDMWAYFGFRRFTTSGTTNFDVELNQLDNAAAATYMPVRTPGDVMFRFEQDGNDAFRLTNGYLWTAVSDPDWKAGCIEVKGYTPRAGWCPTSIAGTGFVGATGENGLFAEGTLNLSALFGEADCRGAFSTMNIRSFTGNSNQSALKDYIEPISIDIPPSCGELKILKVDQFGSSVGGATFTITPNPVPGGTGTLTVVDGGANDPDGLANGIITINPATPGSYTVVETAAPPGYELPPLANRTFTVVVGENGVGSSGPAQVVDRRYFAAPSVVNAPVATYDVDHSWKVRKSVDRNAAEVPEGTTAPFEYTVRLQALPSVRSGYELGGTMTVTNPNTVAMVGTLSSTVTGGSACTISATDVSAADGLQVDLGPGANPFTYTCSPGANPADGSTTATVAWDAATYPQPVAGATYTRSDEDAFSYTVDQRTDEQTTVTDTFDGGAAESLGTFDWDDVWAAPGREVVVKTYTRDIAGVPGACTDHPNTAAESADDTTDSETVTVCVGRDLDVAKTATLGFQRELLWDIAKSGPGTVWTGRGAEGDLERNVRFSVDVTADGMTDSAWALTGTITIDNPNEWAVTGTISDTVVVDGRTLTCEVKSPDVADAAGHQVTIPASTADHPFSYECAGVTQGAYVGKNTVTFDYSADSHEYPDSDDTDSQVEDVTVTGDPDPTNATITISDLLDGEDVTGDLPQASFDWATVNAMTDSTQRISYDVPLSTTADACTPYTNVVTIDQTEQSDSATATVCSPGIEKTVVADFGRKQLWDLTKEVDKTQVEIAQGGQATFGYTVTATARDVVDDGTSSWTGTVSVRNPSTGSLTVDVTDLPAVSGWTCELLDDSTAVSIGAGETAVIDYTCTGSGRPSGSNTATVAFADQQTVSTTVPVAFSPRSPVRDTAVEVYDDKTDPSATPVKLGTADASVKKVWTFTYELVKTGTAGECTTYTNNAVARLEASGNETASSSTELCVERPLTAETSADGTYGVTYPWEIDKEVDRTRADVDAATGEAEFDYTVTVRAGDAQPAGWTLDGEILVSNPNTYSGGAVTLTGATVTTDLGGGATCAATLPGSPVVPAGTGSTPGTLSVPFECTFTGEPSALSGTVDAEVTWDPAGPGTSATASDDGPARLTVGEETHKTVDVIDDKTDPASPVVLERGLTWSQGLEKTYTYSLIHQGTPGACVDRTNTALVDLEPDREAEVAQLLTSSAQASVEGGQQGVDEDGNPTASTTVTVCVESPLGAAATASADLARSYAWSIDKSVDATQRTADSSGNATFRYTVDVGAGQATDSGWRMSGTVTLTNANTWGDPIRTEVTAASDLGGGSVCVVQGGSAVDVPRAGEGGPGSVTLPISCTFSSAPAATGKLTVNATWDPAGEATAASAGASVPVGFAVRSETNKVVDVVDDKTVPGQRVVLAEDLTWEPGLTRSYTYDLTVRGGAAGQCAAYTNTASVDLTVGTDPSDSVSVQACTPAVVPPPEVAPEQAFGKAVGSVTATCQGTVRSKMANRTGERVVYTLRVGKRTHKVSVAPGANRRFQTSGAARARVVLKAGGRVLDRVRVPERCAPPDVLPETGLRGATAARLASLTHRWR